jgi:hypothetical protein
MELRHTTLLRSFHTAMYRVGRKDVTDFHSYCEGHSDICLVSIPYFMKITCSDDLLDIEHIIVIAV